METLVRKNYGLLFLITCLISYQVKSINGNPPTFEDYKNTICDNDTVKCPQSGECCQKDPNVKCDNDTFKCESVDCCRQNSQVCRKQHATLYTCIPAIYTGEPKGEPPSTTAETKPPPTVAPTQLQQEQVTPSSEKPKGEPPSTTAGTKPPTTGPTQQQQKEQVTPSSEASGDGKFSAGIGIGIGIGIAICLVVALICGVIAYKWNLKASGLPASGSIAQHEGPAPINKDPPKSEPEPPKDGPENPTSQTEPIPINLDSRMRPEAQNGQSGDTAATTSAGTTRCPTCQRGGTVSNEISSTSSPETLADKSEEPVIDALPNPNDRAICLVELTQPDYSFAETDKLLN